MLAKLILASLSRRLIGYLGVAGLVGFDSDLNQAVGAVAAAGTVVWSVIEKVREYHKAQKQER